MNDKEWINSLILQSACTTQDILRPFKDKFDIILHLDPVRKNSSVCKLMINHSGVMCNTRQIWIKLIR